MHLLDCALQYNYESNKNDISLTASVNRHHAMYILIKLNLSVLKMFWNGQETVHLCVLIHLFNQAEPHQLTMDLLT